MGVVGSGLMGSGIAEVCALAGHDVVVREITGELAEAGRARIEKSMMRGVDRERMTTDEREGALGRLSFTTDLGAMADRQFVVEAATELEEVKKQIFADLDAVVEDSTAILASNTSSIPITRLARSTSRPKHVIGTHFFSPVPAMQLVEIVTTLWTSDATVSTARAFVQSIGKEHIMARDRAGFVVNMLLVPFMIEAIRMYEQGFASPEDIDKGMRLGANHPMGPLELSDAIGLDVMKQVADVLFEEFRLPQYAPPPVLARMVEAGQLGRKTGKGFYDYS